MLGTRFCPVTSKVLLSSRNLVSYQDALAFSAPLKDSSTLLPNGNRSSSGEPPLLFSKRTHQPNIRRKRTHGLFERQLKLAEESLLGGSQRTGLESQHNGTSGKFLL
ncbi:uncharacterized protein LOC105157764 [Sesamum indicum]|uniref:Uncharacterized protein LOC105157764 n=1 Tax=Sesamum indicum TaxID=4182 RepID=A0A6I9SRL7_SESIN|nr:uncharacterized protein LOC105157764 [Sesamum indicum]